MTAKMIGRHPHVFGDTVAETPEAVMAVWDELKSAEKPARTSVLDGIPDRMPSLLLAAKLVGRAEKVGVTLAPDDVPEDEESLGASLLAQVVGARARGLDPERALRLALRNVRDEISAAEAAARL